MASQTFQYSTVIKAPAQTIYEHLATPENYIGLSPLVTWVGSVEREQDGDGKAMIRYEAIEMFRFLGVLRYPNRIKVRMILSHPYEEMLTVVDTVLSVQMRFVYTFRPEQDGTQFTETVTAQTPGLLRGFVVAQAKAVQQVRAQVLKQRLENG
jgi:ligand-binding SRPBCC domain-containing protein